MPILPDEDDPSSSTAGAGAVIDASGANYESERTAQGLAIFGVEISRETPAEEKESFGQDLTVRHFEEMIRYFDLRVSEGKIGAFILNQHFGPAVGWITRLWIRDDDILMADLMITDPDAIGKIDLKLFTERSIEFAFSHPRNDGGALLKGVALLSGTFGHDSDGLPDLTVEMKNDFVLASPLHLTYDHDYLTKNQTGESDMTVEQRLAKLEADNKSLRAENEKLKTSIQTKASEPSTSGGQVDTKQDIVSLAREEGEKMVAKRLDEMEKQNEERELEFYVKSLSEKTGLSTKVLRAKFDAECNTAGERKVLFNHLKETAGTSIKNNEGDWVAPSREQALREGFKTKGGEERFGIPEEKYVELHKTIHGSF